MAQVQITPVPYKGGVPALTDLIGGHVPMTFNNIPESLGQVQAGAVRPLGVTTAARSPVLPNVPTIAEFGVPGYDTGVWWGVLAPAGLPADVQAKIAKDCVDIDPSAGGAGQTAAARRNADRRRHRMLWPSSFATTTTNGGR